MFLFLFPEVIGKYRNKIQGLDKDLKEILKQESEEKEVNKHACMQLSSHSGMQLNPYCITVYTNFDIGLFTWPRLFERWIALSTG